MLFEKQNNCQSVIISAATELQHECRARKEKSGVYIRTCENRLTPDRFRQSLPTRPPNDHRFPGRGGELPGLLFERLELPNLGSENERWKICPWILRCSSSF